jgi:DNA-binding transcriptional ArsR family regulator
MTAMVDDGPSHGGSGGADAYEAIFTALAHPARRRILISLNFAGGAMTAGQIAGLFAHAWPTTTRHLQLLEAAGILRHERQGRTRLYRLNNARLALARDWLTWFERDPVTAKEKVSEPDETGTAAVPAQYRGRRA